MSVGLDEIGGSGKAFSFENVGDKVTGVITAVSRKQQTSYDGEQLLTWDDGSPRMLTYIELQTDLRDGDDDEGVRSLWAKGGNFEAAEGKGMAMEKAIVEAVKKAGARSIDEGATLTVAHSGTGKATTRGYQPPKLYVAKYEPPTASVDVDDLFD